MAMPGSGVHTGQRLPYGQARRRDLEGASRSCRSHVRLRERRTEADVKLTTLAWQNSSIYFGLLSLAMPEYLAGCTQHYVEACHPIDQST